MTYHALMYLACERTMTGIKQLQRTKWVEKTINRMRTKARQPMDILCMGVRQLPMEDLCDGVKQLQLGFRHLPLEDLCVGIRQLQPKNMN